MKRMTSEDGKYVPCKLGTHSKGIWVHEEDMPLEEGKHIRYIESRAGKEFVGPKKPNVGYVRERRGRFPHISVDGTLSEVEAYDEWAARDSDDERIIQRGFDTKDEAEEWIEEFTDFRDEKDYEPKDLEATKIA